MNKKIAKKFIYEGLGFPYELHNVEMIEVDGKLCPKIDVKKVAESAMKFLVSQPTRLTGNQIKFIRTYFSKSLREFSLIVHESHMAVKKWEDFKDQVTNMDLNIELVLRLYIYSYVAVKSKNNTNEIIKFYGKYVNLIEEFSNMKIKKKRLHRNRDL